MNDINIGCEYQMQIQQGGLDVELISSLEYPSFLLDSLHPQNQNNPVLNKVISKDQHFFCGYSNGHILQYSWDDLSLKNVFHPYHNMDVIDLALYDSHNILSSTHSQLTLHNLHKNKSLNLKGHEQTVIALDVHPFSPLVVSVSNLIIHHDLRMKSPINVNFVTPPVYRLEYFRDGGFYLLSGEPCRVGKFGWMRTLLAGIGTVSHSGKYVLTNEMNSKIRMWNWRTSEVFAEVPHVNNLDNYQPVYFGHQHGALRDILFLEDDGVLLKHNLLTNATQRKKIVNVQEKDTWKMLVSPTQHTDQLLIYEHHSATIKCYQL